MKLKNRAKSTTGKLLAATVIPAALAAANPAQATDFDQLLDLGQQQFEALVENVGAVTHYKAIAPAEPLGIIGFDVALELSATDIDGDIFDIASGGSIDESQFFLPRLHVHKGLPFGIDLGASLAVVPTTDIIALGAELRYAFLKGSIITPAVAARVHYSVIQGVDELDVDNSGVELTISKGFLMFTPYAGIGAIRTSGSANGVAGLNDESVNQEKVYVGLNINLGFNFGVEADRTGDFNTFSIKAGLRF